MPEPLKNLYNQDFIGRLSAELSGIYSPFNSEGFQNSVFAAGWEQKELKQRMRHISICLHQFLPENYLAAIEILTSLSSNFSGFEYMLFPDYVELYGLDEYEQSIQALEHFTKFSTSELAIRVFIQQYPDKTMEQMETWAESDNHHLRRLASEGCRPRLPWAMALAEFKRDPSPVIKILEKLKYDKSEYVRRSVANNLNDISKDNPEVMIKIAKRWYGHNSDTDWLVKHACRTLLKQAVPEVMALFGFAKPDHIRIQNFNVQKTVAFGKTLEFSFALQTQNNQLGKIRIEYAIDFMKNNGKPAQKIFKISESECLEQKKNVSKKYSFKPISTRKYYPGRHGITILLNGVEMISDEFQLEV